MHYIGKRTSFKVLPSMWRVMLNNKSQRRHLLLCLLQAHEVESGSQALSRGNSGKNNDVVTWSEREKAIGNAAKSEFLHPISKFPISNGSFFHSNDQGVTYIKMFISKI